MNTAIVRNIAAQYGLGDAMVAPAQSGYRNLSHKVSSDSRTIGNIIIYKQEPGIVAKIRFAEYVARTLHKAGLPVRRQIDNRITKLDIGGVNRYAGLYNYLPGHTISWEAYSKDHLRCVGITLARMHRILQETSTQPFAPLVINEYIAITKRMTEYFKQPDVVRAMQQKLRLEPPRQLERYKKLLQLCDTQLPKHALHMDFVRGNILFADRNQKSSLGYGSVSVSGILDFEKASVGPPMLDVARTLAFLLVDTKYKTNSQVRRYFRASGYHKHGGGNFETHILHNNQKIDVFEHIVDLFLLYDLYKFLLHNPYESLRRNEHFCRTRDLLVQRGKVTAL